MNGLGSWDMRALAWILLMVVVLCRIVVVPCSVYQRKHTQAHTTVGRARQVQYQATWVQLPWHDIEPRAASQPCGLMTDLRTLNQLQGGDFFLGGVIAGTLTKLMLRLRSLGAVSGEFWDVGESRVQRCCSWLFKFVQLQLGKSHLRPWAHSCVGVIVRRPQHHHVTIAHSTVSLCVSQLQSTP